MSVQTALDNIALRRPGRWAHTEYSLEYHKSYLASRTGRDVETADRQTAGPGSADLENAEPKSGEPSALAGDRLRRAAYDRFGFDLLWSTDDGLITWSEAGRTTDMGHAAYAHDGSDQREPLRSPFDNAEEVWAFDAVREYGLPDFAEQVRAYEDSIRRSRERFPNQLTTGGYYKTIVSGAIEAFGWEMLLLAAAEPAKLERVLDGFFRRTLFHMEAWAETTVEAVIQHDDFVWAGGPFMHPDIYRKVIIPRYAELWKPVHRAGKKVLFCSDGDFTEFAADIAEAGADGLIFEPCMDFGFMVERLGGTQCLVGSFVDCRDLTFGSWEAVRREMDATFERLEGCRGAILAVGNHLPPNIPEGMLDRYFGYLMAKLQP